MMRFALSTCRTRLVPDVALPPKDKIAEIPHLGSPSAPDQFFNFAQIEVIRFAGELSKGGARYSAHGLLETAPESRAATTPNWCRGGA
jgi:hypothetical protein